MSRHRLIKPENFKSSQFRIRAPKKDKQISKNSYPIHLSTLNEFTILQDINKYQNNNKFHIIIR